MKKIMAVTLVFILLCACSAKNGNEGGQTRQDTSSEQIASQISSEQSSEQSEAPEKTESPDSQIKVNIETLEDEGSTFEYVVVTGLPVIKTEDSMFEGVETVEDLLNMELDIFFKWPMVSINYPEPGKTLAVTAEYSIIGNKYISVRAYDTESTEGAEYPVRGMRSNIRDLETGEYAGWLLDFINIDAGLADAVNSGKFVQIYPETPIDGAIDELVTMINNEEEIYEIASNFYLTESGVGLYITGKTHEEGDYWVFEAPYEAIRPVLSEKLLSVIE